MCVNVLHINFEHAVCDLTFPWACLVMIRLPDLTLEATVYSLMAELPGSVPGSGSKVLLLAIVDQVPLQRALMISWFDAKFAGIHDF